MNEPLAVQEAPASYQVVADMQRARPGYSCPPGYKQTELGVIPEDWEQTTIGDVALKVGSGITPRGGSSMYKEHGRPFVRSQNVGWGRLILGDIAYIDDEIHSTFSATELMENDVLLNITGASIGRSALADQNLIGGNVNQHVCIIRSDRNHVNPSFISYFLLSSLGQRQIDSFQAGGNREGLNFGQIRSIKFPLPPTKAEQEAIAEVLSDVDALIESMEQLIAKKRHIKQGVMQELLTGKKRLPGFWGEWEVKRLGDIATFHKGKGLAKSELDPFGSEPCIHYGELFTKYPESISRILSRTNITVGVFRSIANDVLMPTSDVTPNGLATASCIHQDKIVLGGDILVIRADPKVLDGTFLSYVIRQLQDQVMQLVTGTTVFHLYGTDMKKFTFLIPPVEEQHAIVNTLDDMDAELTALETRLAKTRSLKQGMMNNLLTGRIRLL